VSINTGVDFVETSLPSEYGVQVHAGTPAFPIDEDITILPSSSFDACLNWKLADRPANMTGKKVKVLGKWLVEQNGWPKVAVLPSGASLLRN
jgi:hypothetical protein